MILNADARSIPLADGSVHCVVTSPPYWGLRDYGNGAWDGGDSACQHVKGQARRDSGLRTFSGGQIEGGTLLYTDECPCGARRRERGLGLEETFAEYLDRMVDVFREVRRVLRDDGVCWVNMGDSYASAQGGRQSGVGELPSDGSTRRRHPGPKDRDDTAITGWGTRDVAVRTTPSIAEGFKPKDLVGQPWRLAFALQADGWWLRSDCIWAKPNPMPESVTDRPTKAHEYVFLLTKRPRYFYDSDAVRSSASPASLARIAQSSFAAQTGGPKDYGANGVNRNRSSRQTLENFARNPGRNLRTVWDIPTEAYAEAHFATFPRALVEPCVLAGTSERGCCPDCGAPFVRIVESTASGAWHDHGKNADDPRVHRGGTFARQLYEQTYERRATGWRPSCECFAALGGPKPVPCTVLDPFSGSGTTGVMAAKLGRRFVGLELNSEYCALARTRIEREGRLVQPGALPYRPEAVEVPLF